MVKVICINRGLPHATPEGHIAGGATELRSKSEKHRRRRIYSKVKRCPSTVSLALSSILQLHVCSFDLTAADPQAGGRMENLGDRPNNFRNCLARCMKIC